MSTETPVRFDRWPLAALSVGWFMVVVDSTIINVAVPVIGKELHAELNSLQWVVDAYVVTFAGLLLAAGWLGDRIGSKRAFLYGLAVVGLASVGCALAPTVGWLIAARVVQGIGAAVVVPASLACLQATYADRDNRARAVAAWALVGGFAGAIGPLLGGVLTGVFGWRAMFWINIPVAVVGLWLVRRLVPDAASERHRVHLDVAGQVLSVVALVALTAGVVEAGHLGWSSPTAEMLYVTSVGALLALVLVERRVRQPLLAPFADKALVGSFGVGFFINLAFYGALFVMGLYLQQSYGYPAITAGVALLPQTFATVVGTVVGGRLNRRRGPRAAMFAGLPLGVVGLAALAFLPANVAYWALVVPMFAAGLGISSSMVGATSAVVEAARPAQAGVASGALNAARQVGGALGIALQGALYGGHGAGPAFLAGAAAYGGALVCASTVRTPRR